MGALQSLLDSPIDGFPAKTRMNSKFCCQACGMQFDPNRKDSTVNQALWAHAHYLAELCGIWLGSPTPSQRESALGKQLDSSSPLVAFPSTTLPKRSVTSSKPSVVVSTLIKHTDFTKTERSALKHGFFSTMDMNTAGLADCSGLEGCHIRGCLFVEHGSLVFQAADSSHQLPSLLTSRKEESFESSAVRRTQTRGSDPLPPGHDLRDYTHYPTVFHSAYRKTRRKLWSYFHEGRFSSPSRNRESNYGISHEFRGNPRFTEIAKSDDAKFSHLDCRSTEQPYSRSTLHRGDTESGDADKIRLPPPPLRLSWPLCTLRRFGFYGNSLFKLEAGRRAPRGEGHYLFRIRNLRGFRQYFEHFVHRRKSLSPNPPPKVDMKTGSLRLGVNVAPTNQTELETRRSEAESVFLSVQPYLTDRNTFCGSAPRSSLCGLLIDNEGNLTPGSSTLLSPAQVKQKANSLTHSSRGSAVSPTCLDWVRQQQEQQQKQRHSHRIQSNKLHSSDWDPHSRQSVGFQSSCPHLSSTFITTTTTATLASNKRSTFGVDSETDDLISLPEPPPPPTNCPSFQSDGPVDLSEAQKLYDNVDLEWLRSGQSSSEPRAADHVDESGVPREWLNSTGITSASRGRLYTSRRAMTAFACSNLYPIPSRNHEEEEAEDDAIDISEHSVKLESVRQLNSLSHSRGKLGGESATPTSLCSLHCHAGSFQSGDQMSAQESRSGMDSHPRHTSLPNPVSMDALFIASGAIGSYFQPNSQQPSNAQESLVNLADSTLVDRRAEENQQNLPYYNLSSPEALGQLDQAGHSTSTHIGQVLPDSGSGFEPTESNCQVFPVNNGNSRATSVCQSGHRMQGNLCPVQESTRPRMHSCADLVAPATSGRISRTPHPNGSEASVSLHYATLDFGPTPDRSHSSVELRGASSVVCTECTNEHPIHEIGNPWDGRSPVCPMRVYGTFVDDPMGRSSYCGSRVRSLSSSGAPTIHPSNMDTINNELPANYVAICQLQTLAMRAVLNATT